MRSRCQTARGALGLSTRRRGTVLTWFAIFLFVLLPLMTIIMHLGMVTLTRRQMQNAVNSAAIEGLRLRDDGPPEWNDSPPPDDLVAHCGAPPTKGTPEYKDWLDCARRWSANRQIAAVYDDNLNSDGDDALRLGAGPIIAFDDESTDIALPGTNFKAARTIRSENIGVYVPALELNTDNEQHGDMVSGQYNAAGSHSEENDYQRNDFDPTGNDDAFLVRLRRTNNPGSLDALTNISSSGPTIPFLFGRGPYGGSDFLNRRERGTIVRATAIAQAQPVITVGVPSPTDNLDAGLAIFELELDSWTALTPDVSAQVLFNPDGSITGDTIDLTGRFIARSVTTLGDSTTPLGMVPELEDLEINSTRVVAITTTVGMVDHIVVGFGLAVLNDSSGNYSITRLSGAVVFQNAVAGFVKPLSASEADFTEVWSTFQNNVPDRALAPALVRSIE